MLREAFCVGDDGGFSPFEDRQCGVRGAQVDAYTFAIMFPSLYVWNRIAGSVELLHSEFLSAIQVYTRAARLSVKRKLSRTDSDLPSTRHSNRTGWCLDLKMGRGVKLRCWASCYALEIRVVSRLRGRQQPG